MNPHSAAILANPHPCGHIVYPYTDESLVEHAVGLFASSGIRNGEAVILIMTSDHYERIRLRLRMEGCNVATLERSGLLTCLTTEDLLVKFMVNQTLNEDLFRTTISDLIHNARSSFGHPRSVRIFGEMVSQLRGTDLMATTRLEDLWNEIVREHSVSLLCTYALHHADDYIPKELIDLHSQRLEGDPSGARE